MGKIKLSERNSLHIINENPYRVLGVYANTSLKDIMANKSKTIAFMKVGKTVSFPMDLEFVMPTVTRTQESVDASISTISTNQDKIKYAQFWFLNVSRFDEVAFKNLFDGNCSTAMEIWGKVDKLSHLQNLIVCYLISKDYESALMIAQKLYGDFGDEFVKTVDSNCTLNVTGMDLWHQFIDIIGAEVGMQTLLTCVYEKKELEPTIKYIVGQLMDSITARILNEIEKSKNVNHKDSEARIQGARNLIRNIRNDLNLMKSVLGEQDSRYIMIVDKYATEILQCSIDYYNNTHGVMTAHTAMKMLNFADGIVGLSTIVKQRIAENRKILQKIIDKLPPMEVAEDSKVIKDAIDLFINTVPKSMQKAQGLLEKVKPILKCIEKKLGKENVHYVDVSTSIVQTVCQVMVCEVNKVQETNKFVTIHDTLKIALDIINKLDDFEINNDFAISYKNIKDTLVSLCSKFGINIDGTDKKITNESVLLMIASDNSICWYCGGKATHTNRIYYKKQNKKNYGYKKEITTYSKTVAFHICDECQKENDNAFLFACLGCLFVLPLETILASVWFQENMWGVLLMANLFTGGFLTLIPSVILGFIFSFLYKKIAGVKSREHIREDDDHPLVKKLKREGFS